MGAAEVAAQHPEFVKARKNEKLRVYVASSTGFVAYAHGVKMRMPSRWDGTVRVSAMADEWVDRHKDGMTDLQAKIDHPYMIKTDTDCKDKAIVADYRKLWAEFGEAQTTLRETIEAYTVREKFEADFPELAAYLPARTVKTSTAIAIPVGDVRKKLAKVGVPPKKHSKE